MKHLLFILSFVLVVSVTSCKDETNGEVQEVTPEEMITLLELDDVQLVDVRTPEEYKEGYIENFQNIDYYSDSFEKDIEKLDKSKPIIVYCKSGTRSGKCSAKMKERGFVKVYDLKGGISRWKHEGLDLKEIP